MASYLETLGLSEKELFDATGNMFDPDSILARIACPLQSWLIGGHSATAAPANPAAACAIYNRLKALVTANGFMPCNSPTPRGMEHIFASILGWDRSGAAWTAPITTQSGKRGRGDQQHPSGSRPRL
eukprot:2936604-Heterocapsa_arctica.AAC.1